MSFPAWTDIVSLLQQLPELEVFGINDPRVGDTPGPAAETAGLRELTKLHTLLIPTFVEGYAQDDTAVLENIARMPNLRTLDVSTSLGKEWDITRAAIISDSKTISSLDLRGWDLPKKNQELMTKRMPQLRTLTLDTDDLGQHVSQLAEVPRANYGRWGREMSEF